MSWLSLLYGTKELVIYGTKDWICPLLLGVAGRVRFETYSVKAPYFFVLAQR
jgi:hypothetical protein